MALPAPPDPAELSPLFETWPQGAPIVRIHERAYASTSFAPGGGLVRARGRFHHFRDQSGDIVPALYGAEDVDCALAEVVFRELPLDAPDPVLLTVSFRRLSLSLIRTRRALRLVQLHGHGLRRLRVRSTDLTASPASAYPETVRWAQALHAHDPSVDGLVWMSARFNSRKALVLFGDRVSDGDLEVAEPPIPLLVGEGRKLLERAANLSGIVIA